MTHTILHIMGMDSSKYGGLEHFNVALGQALRTRGYKSIFVYESQPADPHFVSDLEAAGATLKVCPSRGSKIRFCIDIIRIIAQNRPCLVHAHFTKARFYALPIAWLMGIRKRYFTIHGEIGLPSTAKPHTRWWYTWASRHTQIIAVSDAVKAQYQKGWPNANIARHYLGTNPIEGSKTGSRPTLNIPDNQMMIACVANFNHIKGLDILCQAIAILVEEKSLPDNTHFYIIGQPQADRDELSRLTKQLDIEKHITLVGISHQVKDYLLASDIYLQPSRSEGLPLAMMEAASAGLAMIGSRVGGIPEIIDHQKNGLLVDPENPAQLADAIKTLMLDPSTRRTMGQASQAIYRTKFSITAATSHLIDHYNL